MDITISVSDGVPIYRQIVNQIRYMVASGLLQAGEEVSPIRTLALQLNVTPNTVVKAYGELESAGIVHKRQGAGTYVSESVSPLADRERIRILENRIDALLAEAHQLDFEVEDVVKTVHQRSVLMERGANQNDQVEENT
ncbi:MAG: GntR family transcriptional regulator [Gammaproteobacteria bacterium]|nr:GntR family transcriptional regulator [Gammaproteobacteria bacterium]